MTKNKTRYVDGFVFVVSKKKIKEYIKMAEGGAKIWIKCGALDYKECIGDDLYPNMGMPMLTFQKLAKIKKGETVWFSYITYKSKVHRDFVNKKVMAMMDKEPKKYKDMPMPFDMKRMAYGGFKVVVSN